MKKCLEIGCIFEANNLTWVGDFVVDVEDGTIFLTNVNNISNKFKPWIILTVFERISNKFKAISAKIDEDLFLKFKISEDIKIKIKQKYTK